MRKLACDDLERRAQLMRRDYLTVAEAAYMVFKSVTTINTWVQAGMPSYRRKLDGRRYVKLAEVHDWAQTHPTRRRQ